MGRSDGELSRAKFTFGRISEEVWNRKDVVPSVVFYAGMGGLSKGAIVKKGELWVICAGVALSRWPLSDARGYALRAC